MQLTARRTIQRTANFGGQSFHWLFVLALVAAALLVGLVAATSSLLLVGLVAGAIFGALLLGQPQWAIGALILLGLTMGVVISLLGPGFARLTWGVTLLGFFLFLPSSLHIAYLRRAPLHVHAALAFVLLAVGSAIVQWHSASEILAGVKRYFLPYGLIAAMALIPFQSRDLVAWRRLWILLATLQLPFALYEFLVLVPKRGGLEAGSAVTDVVSGTMGANLHGGSPNAVMAVFLLITFSFALAWWREGLIKARWIAAGLVFAFVPIGLGEVKVAFVLIPLMFIILFREDILKKPAKFIGIALLCGLILLTLGYVLIEWIMRKDLSKVIETTLAYNLHNVGYGEVFLNRFTALTFWWQHQGLHDPVGFVLGNGLGSSHFDDNALVVGHVARNWPRHGIGLTAASQMLWDVGVLGFGLFLLILFLAWRAAGALRKGCLDKRVAADANALQAAIAFFALMTFYNHSLVTLPSMQIIFGAALGYLAYLARRVRS